MSDLHRAFLAAEVSDMSHRSRGHRRKWARASYHPRPREFRVPRRVPVLCGPHLGFDDTTQLLTRLERREYVRCPRWSGTAGWCILPAGHPGFCYGADYS